MSGCSRIELHLPRYSNPSIANLLPCPLLSLATFQLQGVSQNHRPWLSPYGVLQWSLLLELPPGLEHMSKKLDPLMHLIGLTIVETCRLYLPISTASAVALKWPNDIYATIKGRLEKIGEIVVNNIPRTLSGSRNRIVIGKGKPPFEFRLFNAITGSRHRQISCSSII